MGERWVLHNKDYEPVGSLVIVGDPPDVIMTAERAIYYYDARNGVFVEADLLVVNKLEPVP